MPEKQGIYNIDKQEAGRDILNIVIQHPITHEPVYIPSIQSVLRKGETSEGDFFKKEPEWVDFEQGFIIERKEIDEIIKRLEKDKIQLVLGAPASGKSVILKNVGFKIASQNKVYVVELKKHPGDEVKLFFENIPKINDENPIFIIDDAHLYLSDCERLIRNFRSNGKGNLVIGSRETKEIIEGDQKVASEFEHLSKTAIHIQAEDVTEEMITNFLKAKYKFSEKKMRTFSDNIEKYKKDLWFLSWALKAYNPKKDVVEDNEIYENIRDSIRRIKAGEKEPINAEDILLPLSIFYRFEIPILRDFLEEHMDIKGDVINQLFELSEIIETEDVGKPIMVSLNHSSIAELYFGAYQKYPSLGKRVRQNILKGRDEKIIEFCLFFQYLTIIGPRNTIAVMSYLGKDWKDEKGGLTLLKKLVETDKIKTSIEKGLEHGRGIGTIAHFLGLIAEINSEVALELANHIDIDSLSAEIDNEENIEKIGWCMSDISKANINVALNLANHIDIDTLSVKLEKEEDLDKIKWFMLYISKANKELALKLVDVFSSKIENEDIEEIGDCVWFIGTANKEVALKLVNLIDIDVVSAKIEKIENIRKIRYFVISIESVSKEVATEIVNQLNPKLREALQAKIESYDF